MLPTMMSQPSRASGSLGGMRPNRARNQLPMMRTMSRQKNTTTAASVPVCVIAVKAAPGSCADGRNSPKMRRCELEAIGRNSVSPWTKPRMIASRSMGAFQPCRTDTGARHPSGDSVGAEQVGEHALPEDERVDGHTLVDAVEHAREVEVGGQAQRREAVA